MLPFSVEQFFSVFAAYNTTIWPAQIAAYLLGAIAVGAILTARRWAGRSAAAILGLMWLWNGLAYHLFFFAPINPAAYGFASLFVVQGAIFIGCAVVDNCINFPNRFNWRCVLGGLLICYAGFVYPALGYVLGHSWPYAPIFGVAPCPTTIFTFGLLMMAVGPLSFWLVAIPVVWSAIGGTAAVLLSVPEDLGLLASGILGAVLLPFCGRRSGNREPPVVIR
jgi:hypothetical protein